MCLPRNKNQPSWLPIRLSNLRESLNDNVFTLCFSFTASSLHLYHSIFVLVHASLLSRLLPPVCEQVSVSIDAVCRGDLSISLESPAGTVSLLLDTRPNDASAAGLKNWTLMTVHCWGEHPRGLWSLKVPKGNVFSDMLLFFSL